MQGFFIFVGALLMCVCAVLHFFPNKKTLNFVDYSAVRSVIDLNRYAATTLFFPAAVCFVSAYAAHFRPEISIHLCFLNFIAMVGTAIWTHIAIVRRRL